LAVLHLCIVYTTTGLQKLVSTAWTPLDGFSALFQILQSPHWARFPDLIPTTGSALAVPLGLLTAVTIVWEVCFFVVLWNPRLRLVFLLVGVGVHLGIFALMEVGIFSVLSLAFYPVLLSPELDDPDVQVIKSIVAITNSPTRRAEPYHIVAELKDDKNVSVARMVGKNEIEVILAGDLISRITVQTCRQSGLSVVHTELLDFGGDEIYFKAEPALLGRTFGEALSAFKKCAIIGVYANGQSQVLPPLDRVITAADQLIVIAADDDVIKVSNEKVEIIESAILSMDSPTMAAERTLILGWNERAAAIVKGLDAYVSKGSSLLLISEGEHGDALTEAVGALNNLTVEVRQADTTSRALLDSLDVATWDHIIVLCAVRDFGWQDSAALGFWRSRFGQFEPLEAPPPKP
jgi:Trk K+ transport system NAD-binding subunit